MGHNVRKWTLKTGQNKYGGTSFALPFCPWPLLCSYQIPANRKNICRNTHTKQIYVTKKAILAYLDFNRQQNPVFTTCAHRQPGDPCSQIQSSLYEWPRIRNFFKWTKTLYSVLFNGTERTAQFRKISCSHSALRLPFCTGPPRTLVSWSKIRG